MSFVSHDHLVRGDTLVVPPQQGVNVDGNPGDKLRELGVVPQLCRILSPDYVNE